MFKKENLAVGKLLLAEPFLKDEYFIRSVVILAEYGEEGAFGFVLNRSLELGINDVLDNFPTMNSLVFLGGPVARDNIFYVHTYGDVIEGSKLIKDGLFWGGDFEILKNKIEEGVVKEENIRFLAGYSGWEKGQLEREIKDKNWIVTDFNSKELLLTNPEKMWKKILNQMGGEYALMANYPIDPTLN